MSAAGKLVALVPALVPAAFRDTSAYTFEAYVAEFGKTHGASEAAERRARFEEQLKKVNKHNEEYLAGRHTWYAAVNEYSDWHEHELATLRSGIAGRSHGYRTLQSSRGANPSRVDWREQNVVTPVKNQGGCGSCWAFSAIEVVESHYAIAAKLDSPVLLAPQAYVNCVQNPNKCGGSGGCQGATMELAFNLTAEVGVPLETDLPYKGANAECSDYKAAVKGTGYVKLPENDAQALETALATVGPVSVTVSANWVMYGGGVYEGGCGDSGCTLNHGVVAVGYDQDYWLVRNSWGTGWGEKGYIRLTRKFDSQTFVDSMPQDGVACVPYPESQTVGGESGILFDTSYPTGLAAVELVV
jgi:cathepsin L